MMPALRFNSKAELLDALEARRPWAKRLDAAAMLDHTAAEKKHLEVFRTACREAAKWDYPTAKSHYFQVRESNRQPYCPKSLVANIDRHLAIVRATRQERFQISDSGMWSQIYFLLTHDETIKAEMC